MYIITNKSRFIAGLGQKVLMWRKSTVYSWKLRQVYSQTNTKKVIGHIHQTLINPLYPLYPCVTFSTVPSLPTWTFILEKKVSNCCKNEL